VDFNLPQRFGITYIDADGARKTPVMIHRAIVGSIERFIGILIEHYAGKFPFWLAPTQIVVASVTDESAEYARKVARLLRDADYRVELDTENEKINYKIRQHSLMKVPAIVIIGKQEETKCTLSIRTLGSDKTETISIEQMLKYFKEIECKSRTK
ncbi:MAG: threonine--tRNA ligase, partial [Alphaproteobacteria bacterium]|nr:threonine--tRNA ligase [Alphaproteobacteria bacterium]